MEAIQKKQEPRMKACLAYRMLPSATDVAQLSHDSETQEQHLYDYGFTFDLQPNPSTRCHPTPDNDDDTSYEQIPSTPCYVTSHAPKSPPLPPKPSTMGETHPAVYSGDAAAYYNLPPYGTQTRPAPQVSPSPRRKLPAATAQERENHNTFSSLYRTASFLNMSQIEQLLTMLWNIQSTSTKEDEKRAPNNEICDSAGEILHFPSTSSPPLETQQIKAHLSPEPEKPECSHNDTHTIPPLVAQKSPTPKHLPHTTFDKNSSAMPPTQYKLQTHPDSRQQLSKLICSSYV